MDTTGLQDAYRTLPDAATTVADVVDPSPARPCRYGTSSSASPTSSCPARDERKNGWAPGSEQG